MTVMIANGDRIPCLGYCKEVPFTIQGNHFQTSFHLLTLGGCEIVLGVNWLRTLGPIL